MATFVLVPAAGASRPVRAQLRGHGHHGSGDRAADQVQRLVYLDAFVPDEGQSWWDLANDHYRSPGPTGGYRARVPRRGGIADLSAEALLRLTDPVLNRVLVQHQAPYSCCDDTAKIVSYGAGRAASR